MQSTATKQPDVFNGLPLFETRTTWLGGMRSRSRIDACEVGGQRIERHHVIEADEPPQILGTDTAPNPRSGCSPRSARA